MPLTWADYRNRIRRTILNDNPTDVSKRRWPDTDLVDYLAAALDVMASHTAMATATAFQGVTGLSIALPENVYTDIDLTGMVFLQTGTLPPEYLNPIYYTKDYSPMGTAQGFYTSEGSRMLNFGRAITVPATVTVRYFALYNHPVGDDDTIDCPTWMLTALGYQIASNAIMGYSMRTDQIRQWGENPETGKPTDNPFRAQQEWLQKQVNTELSHVPKQNRDNYFRR